MLLRVRDLAYSTPDHRPLIAALSFDVQEGEILSIVGPNGIGKSTLLQILAGVIGPQRGEVRWSQADIKRGLLTQQQNREFHIPLTLGDVLSFSGLRPAPADIAHYGLLDPSQVGLAWNTASGGERQKTLLTRAFLQQPQVLLLDEPLNHLDRGSRETLQQSLRNFVGQGERAVIMICHETTLATDWARQIDLKGYAIP